LLAQQKIERSLQEIENSRLLLSVQKLKIETDITKSKNEQLIIEKELENLELGKQKRQALDSSRQKTDELNALAGKQDKTPQDRARMTELDVGRKEDTNRAKMIEQQIALNKNLQTQLANQNRNNEQLVNTYAQGVQAQVRNNQRSLADAQATDRIDYTLNTRGSSSGERRQAYQQIDSLLSKQLNDLSGVFKDINTFSTDVSSSNRQVAEALSNFSQGGMTVSLKDNEIRVNNGEVVNALQTGVTSVKSSLESLSRNIAEQVRAGSTSKMENPSTTTTNGANITNNISVTLDAEQNVNVESTGGVGADEVAGIAMDIINAENSKIAGNIESRLRNSL
jgi:hypothetical protein